MPPLSKLFCNPDQVQELIILGIEQRGLIILPYDNGVWVFDKKIKDLPKLPAWTMQELHIMIGAYFVKPDLPAFNEMPKARQSLGNLLVYYLRTIKSVREYPTGAIASAAMLSLQLQDQEITSQEANSRYEDFFYK